MVGYAAASGLVSSQRAVIHHATPHGYGSGVSSRYFDKSVSGLGHGHYGLGFGYGPGYYGGLGYRGGYRGGYLGGYYGGNAYDGIDNLGLAYNNYDLADRRFGFRGLGYGLGGYYY